ncbi:hypothetical protein ABZU25_23410 [Micromonospora sp. NPDC005215]|uniref:hypothetical protein n=1 Tax=Micromonospora sp. NPDC005215 TaxID=3157024 RepID=UPI0033B458D8
MYDTSRETVTPLLRHWMVGAVECGEPLIDLTAVPALRLRPTRRADLPVRLRLGVVDRIVAAQSLLPVHLRLLVVDGYRPARAQAGHPESAMPGNLGHHTGGEADLTLCDPLGQELWLGSAVYDIDPPGTPPELTVGVQCRRLLLRRALSTVGMVGSPRTWWHWCYGNRQWAGVAGARTAPYHDVGTAEP